MVGEDRFYLKQLLLSVVTLLASCVSTWGQFIYEERFTGTEAAGWEFAQDIAGTAPGPRLTAQTAPASSDPENGNPVIDSDGSGWLRLATTNNNQSNAVAFDTAIPASSGNIRIGFDYTMWGGVSDADGITVFLWDAGVNFDPGAFGGSLGYAQRTANNGLAGGYIGVGLDAWGNFSNDTEGRSGSFGNPPGNLPNALNPNQIVVRGPDESAAQDGSSGFEYMAGTGGNNYTQSGNPAIASLNPTSQSLSFPSYSNRPDQDDADYRYFEMELDENDILTVRAQFGFNGSLLDLFQADLSGINRPDQLRIGFAASTGGALNVHEIRRLVIETSGGNDSVFWDSEGGNQNWSTSTNWHNDTVPSIYQGVVFPGLPTADCGVNSFEPTETVIVNGSDKTQKSITFSGPTSYTLDPSGSQRIILERDADASDAADRVYVSVLNNPNGNADHTINVDLEATDRLYVQNLVSQTLTLGGDLDINGNATDFQTSGGGTTQVNGVISGSGDIISKGRGTTVFAGANTFTGDVTVEDGMLEIQNSNALGNTSANTTVLSGATLALSNNISTPSAESLTLSGSGLNNQGALRNLSGTNTFAGDVTFAASSTLGTDANSSFTTSGTLALGPSGRSATFLVGDNATHTHTGNITSSAFGGDRVIKEGLGTLVITSSLSHQGANIIREGTMEIRNSGGLGSAGSVGTTVESGGTLALANNISLGYHELRLNGPGATGKAALWNAANNNSVANNITLQSDTAIGAAAGTTLTLTQGITTGGGYNLTINGPGTVQTNNNLTNISSLNIEQGTLNLNGNVTPSAPTTTIATGATLRSQNNSNTLGSIAGGGNIELSTSAAWQTLTFGGNNANTTFSGTVSGLAQMTKVGTGTTTFSGTNTLTGTLNLSGGTVALGADNVFADTMTLTLNGGTFATNGFSDTMGNLTRSAASTLDFAGNGSVLTFASTSGTGSISINNWSGNITGGSSDQFRVNSIAAPGNLASINFTGWGTGAALVGAAGSWEIVPTLTGFRRWDNTGAGSNWGTNNNWVGGGPQPNATGAKAYFGDDAPNATQTVILEGSKTIGNVVLAGTGNRNYNFNASGVNRTLTFNQTGAADAHLVVVGNQSHVIGAVNTNNQRVSVSLSDNLLIQNNSTAATGLTFGTLNGSHIFRLNTNSLSVTGTSRTIIHSRVRDSGSIIKDGEGILRLTDTQNSFSGGVTLNDGTIEIGSTAAFGTGTLTINGGAVEAFGAARSISNAYTINNDYAVTGTENLTFTGAGTIAAGTHTISVSPAITHTLSGSLTGTGGLIKDGDGILAFTGGTKTFSGGLTINDGSVDATRNGDITLGTADSGNNIAGAGAITVNTGGTFNLTQNGNSAITLRGEPLTNNGGIINISSDVNNENRDFFIGTDATNTGHFVNTGGTTNIDVGDDIRVRANSSISVSGGTVNLNPADAFITEGTAGNAANIAVTNTGTLNIDITSARSANNQITIGQHDILTVSGADATATFTGQANSNINLNGTINLTNNGTLLVTQGNTFLASTTTLNGGSSSTAGTLVVSGNLSVNEPTVANRPNITINANSNTNITAPNANSSITDLGTLTKTGAGTTTITSNVNNIEATDIVINGGTLLNGSNNQIANQTNMTLGGGTYDTGGFDEVLGTLTLTADSTIDLNNTGGGGDSILRFAASKGETWAAGSTLTITGWSGNLAGGGTDQVYFGNGSCGLTNIQTGQIAFVDPDGFDPGTYGAVILSTGEVVPIIPEAETWVALATLLTVGGFLHYRRKNGHHQTA